MSAELTYDVTIFRLPEGAVAAEKKVTFDQQDDMAVINVEEPVTFFKRTTSVRLPSLGKWRELEEKIGVSSTIISRKRESSL